MKAKKPKNQGVTHQPASPPNDPLVDEAFIRYWSEEFASSLPPVSEIAKLAALLVQGQTRTLADFASAANQAIDLWNACDEQRKIRIKELGLAQLARAQAEWKSERVGMPKAFPVSLDDLLKLALPKKRPEDRMKAYREFVRAALLSERRFQSNGQLAPVGKISAPTDDDCVKVIDQDRASGFDEFGFQPWLTALRQFSALHDGHVLKERGRAAGLKSAAKRKGKKDIQRSPAEKMSKKKL